MKSGAASVLLAAGDPTSLVSAPGSMGRRNTRLEVYLQRCHGARVVRER
jgi:hypothetical protein